VLFNVLAVVGWAFTSEVSRAPLHRAVCGRLGPYMTVTGLRQGWTMFAPNPIRANVYVEAEVTFADGSRAVWAVPRMEQLGHLRRQQKERFRKWSTERLGMDRTNPALARAAARYAARQVGARPGNPPRRVDLVRYTRWIPPPARRRLPRDPGGSNPWERATVFACELDDAGAVTKVIETDAAPATAPAGVAAGVGTGASSPSPDGGLSTEVQKGEAR
jgi:hypothetical protein